MLRESYIAVMDRVQGVKLVVTRHYPRGIASIHFDRHIPALAPSYELLRDWRDHRITWEEYAARFREEILSSPEALAALRHIIDLARTKDVYLICWEKSPPCHRYILLDLAEEIAGDGARQPRQVPPLREGDPPVPPGEAGRLLEEDPGDE